MMGLGVLRQRHCLEKKRAAMVVGAQIQLLGRYEASMHLINRHDIGQRICKNTTMGFLRLNRWCVCIQSYLS